MDTMLRSANLAWLAEAAAASPFGLLESDGFRYMAVTFKHPVLPLMLSWGVETPEMEKSAPRMAASI